MSTGEQLNYKSKSLNEVIKANKNERRGRRIRKINNRRNSRSVYRPRYYKENNTKKDNRRRILVENLNKEIQNPELQKIFESCGKLTRCGIKFDKLGASKGLADIEFSTHEECERAINKYDNAEINGVKMRVKYASNNSTRFRRRTSSTATQRRNVRRINRTNRRGLSSRKNRIRSTAGSSSRRNNFRQKRKKIVRSLGRKRDNKK
jgi:RNA recognition motif-containing protein